MARQGHAEAEIGGIVYRITPQLVEDLRGARLDDAIAGLGAALLVLHATHDRTADISHGERIFAAAAQPKSLIALPGADHLLSHAGDAQYAAAMIAAWVAPYLDGESA
jgi:putative redox protein